VSGDNHAAKVCQQLFRIDSNAIIYAYGSKLLSHSGVQVLKNFDGFGTMGVGEVLLKLNSFKKLLKECHGEIKRIKPDVVILVDFGGFNLRLAKKIRALNCKVCYYIPPKVWAWGSSRINALSKYTDLILVTLPFEKDFYEQQHVPSLYVGNPVVESLNRELVNRNSHNQYDVIVLPGSRDQEVKLILPVILALVKKHQDWLFAISVSHAVQKRHFKEFYAFSNVHIVTEDLHSTVRLAKAAIVTSGTATLEVACLRVPQVVVYKTSWLTFILAKCFLRIKYISLVNLLLNKPLVNELIQSGVTVPNLEQQLEILRSDTENQKKISDGYSEILRILGNKTASEIAAKSIYKLGSS